MFNTDRIDEFDRVIINLFETRIFSIKEIKCTWVNFALLRSKFCIKSKALEAIYCIKITLWRVLVHYLYHLILILIGIAIINFFIRKFWKLSEFKSKIFTLCNHEIAAIQKCKICYFKFLVWIENFRIKMWAITASTFPTATLRKYV